MTLGNQLTGSGEHELLKVAQARAGERQATVIFDITAESFIQTRGVRSVSRKKLQKLCKDSLCEPRQ